MELYELTIHELQGKIRAGEDLDEVTASVFDRIDAVEQGVHAYICLLRESAFAEAQAADEEIRRGEVRHLTGIPIALKDIYCTKGVTTTCGSRILRILSRPMTRRSWKSSGLPAPSSPARRTWTSLPWVPRRRPPGSA